MGYGSSLLSARETAKLIGRKKLSPVEVVRRALDEADATQATLNAFTVLRRDEALSEARAAEAAVMHGDDLGALHGLPFSAKDLISVEGLPAGVGTRLRPILESRRDLLDPAVAEILDAALALDMRAYYDAVFRRYALRDEMFAFFGRYDALLSPTLPISALEAGRNIPAGFEHRNLVSWVSYTYPFNLTGQPAASLPIGLSSTGRPVGLQIVTARNDEETALKIAAWLEGEITMTT
jgi:Asp-tRNA(Asn)/Glu-tRNA(Gln) amidotransferase A subunit family amidase